LQTETKKVNSPALLKPNAGVKIQTSKEMNVFNTQKISSGSIQKKQKRYRYKTTLVELLNRFHRRGKWGGVASPSGDILASPGLLLPPLRLVSWAIVRTKKRFLSGEDLFFYRERLF